MLKSFALTLSSAFVYQSVLFAADATVVYVDVVESREIRQLVWFPGTVVAEQQAVVSADGEGVLLDLAEVGQSLAQGETIARLDDELYQLQFDEINAEVDRLAIQVEYLQSELDRRVELATKNSASTSELGRARTDHVSRKLELKSMLARRDRLKRQIEKTHSSAPFSGVVTARLKQPGERVLPGDPLLSLVNPERPIIEVSLPTRQIKYLQVGAALPYEIDGRTADASVMAIVPTSTARHQSQIRLQLNGHPAQIAELVRVGFPTSSAQNVLAVKRDALIIRESKIYLFKVPESHLAKQILVHVGQGHDEWVEIVSDELQVGDRIVIRGGERLQDGQLVAIKEPHTQLVVH